MKTIIPALVVLLLAACSSYQYITVNPLQATKDNGKNIVWENDTLRLTYRFTNDGKLDITTVNKTTKPLYIDWKKSAIIANGKPAGFYDGSANVSGSITSNPGYNNPVTRTFTVNASVSIPEGMSFMPPQTQVERTGINVSAIARDMRGLGADVPVQKLKDDNGVSVSYRSKKYDVASSPLNFRIYLTLVIGNDNKEFPVEHSFYVSEIIESANGLQSIFMKEMTGDRFYRRVPSM